VVHIGLKWVFGFGAFSYNPRSWYLLPLGAFIYIMSNVIDKYRKVDHCYDDCVVVSVKTLLPKILVKIHIFIRFFVDSTCVNLGKNDIHVRS